MELFVKFDFAASRQLPNLPASHPCSRLHGHTFYVELTLTGEIDETTGWLLDFADVEREVDDVKQKLDHRYLNEISGLQNPTTEILATWLWRELKDKLSTLAAVKVQEHPSRGVIYRGE